MLFPVTCPLCGTAGAAPCAACIRRLRPAGRPLPPPGLDELRCLVDYDATGSQLVAALKYRNARRLVPWLAAALGALLPPDVHVITWAPTTPVHRHRRGFDQAAVLARATGRRGGVRVQNLLQRVDRRSQTGRSRRERLAGPRFVARTTDVGGLVVVIDDVVTTGATLAASAEALRRIGAPRVVGLAVAHTRAGRRDPSWICHDPEYSLLVKTDKVCRNADQEATPYGRHDQQP